MPTLIQPTFSKGEIGPALHGRVDTAMYETALATARNAVIHTYGGVSNRSGSIAIGPVKDHTVPPRLIPFHFSTSDQYILEFGHEYMRVIRNDAHVTNDEINISAIALSDRVEITTETVHGFSDGDEVFFAGITGTDELNLNRYFIIWESPTSFFLRSQLTGNTVDGTANHSTYVTGGTVASIFTLTTPYQVEDLLNLKYAQSRDVMTLVHNGYAPRDLARTGHNIWTLTKLDELPVTAHPMNCFNDTLIASNNKRIYYGITAISDATGEESLMGTNGDVKTITAITAANPPVVTSASHDFVHGEEVLIENVGGMTLLNDRRFIAVEVTTNTFELEAEDASTYDAYTEGGTATGVFVVTCKKSIETIDGAEPPEVTFKESHGWSNGDQIWIQGVGGAVEVDNLYHIVSGVGAATVDLLDTEGFDRDEVSVYSKVAESDPHGIQTTFTWDPVEGASHYRVYKAEHHVFGFIGEAREPTFTDERNSPDFTDGPPNGANPFRFAGDTPGATSYYEQRQVFGGSLNNPDQSVYSQTGHRQNFGTSNPTKATDAITASLVSQDVQEIRHYVPTGDMLVFTNSAEWRVNSGGDNAFEINTLRQKPQSEWGSSHNRPWKVGNDVLFVEESRARIRALKYTLEFDSYDSTDLNLLANHLFADEGPDEHLVLDWCFSSFPEPRAYVVRSDGIVCTMTFDAKQKVIAWTRWDTQGKYERTAMLRRSLNLVEDAIYFVVKRTQEDGTVYRSIERMESRKFFRVEDTHFLDAGSRQRNLSTFTKVRVATEAELLTIDEDVESSTLLYVEAENHGFVNGDAFSFENTKIFGEVGEDCDEIVRGSGRLESRQYQVIHTQTDGFFFMVDTRAVGRESAPAGGAYTIEDTYIDKAGTVWDTVGGGNTTNWGGLPIGFANTRPPHGGMIDPGGNFVLIGERHFGRVYKYNTRRAWDVSKCDKSAEGPLLMDGRTGQISTDPDPRGLFITPNGLDVYICDNRNKSSKTLHKYRFATPGDLDTLTLHSTKDFGSETTAPVDIQWSSDGLKMYLMDKDEIYYYTASTPFDMAAVANVPRPASGPYPTFAELTDPESLGFTGSGLLFSEDGLTMWIAVMNFTYVTTNKGVTEIIECTLDIPFNPFTAQRAGPVWKGGHDGIFTVNSMQWNPDGTKMFLFAGNYGTQVLRTRFHRIDATLGDDIKAVQAYGLETPTVVTQMPMDDDVDDVPGGMAFNAAGTQVYYSAKEVTTGDMVIYMHTLSTPYDLSTASAQATSEYNFETIWGTGNSDDQMMSIVFGDQGTKFYVTNKLVVGRGGEADQASGVTMFKLDTAYDLSTVNAPSPGDWMDLYGDEVWSVPPPIPIDIEEEDDADFVECVRFNPTGEIMYILLTVKQSEDRMFNVIHQFCLDVPWDLSKGVHHTGRNMRPTGVCGSMWSMQAFEWHPDGTRFFALFQTTNIGIEEGYRIAEFRVTTPWDVGTGYYEGTYFNLSEEVMPPDFANDDEGTSLAHDIRLHPDGTKFYCSGRNITPHITDTGAADATLDGLFEWNFAGDSYEYIASDDLEVSIAECQINYDVDAFVPEKGDLCKLVSEIGGLAEHEGKEIVVMVDGEAHVVTVSGNKAVLPVKGCYVSVGLPYCCDIETLNIESPDGTIQGKKSKITAVTMRYYKSIMPSIGHDFDNLIPIKGRGTELHGEATKLLSGDNKTILKPHWGSRGRLAVRMHDPYPLTVLAFVPDIIVEDAQNND